MQADLDAEAAQCIRDTFEKYPRDRVCTHPGPDPESRTALQSSAFDEWLARAARAYVGASTPLAWHEFARVAHMDAEALGASDIAESSDSGFDSDSDSGPETKAARASVWADTAPPAVAAASMGSGARAVRAQVQTAPASESMLDAFVEDPMGTLRAVFPGADATSKTCRKAAKLVSQALRPLKEAVGALAERWAGTGVFPAPLARFLAAE
jgi:hypothetical protein